jgi:NhaA family Na+:H+ antiporter
MIFPATLYLAGAWFLGIFPQASSGWAIPTATDITLSYTIGRLIFGAKHKALSFLITLAIVDDALGLIIIAVFYNQESFNAWWLLLTAAAVGIAAFFRTRLSPRYWWYLMVPGLISWFGMGMAGLNPALGFAPIIPFIPHAPDPDGTERSHTNGHELNEFARHWSKPVEIIIGIFALVNVGVIVSAPGLFGPVFFLVLIGLLVGKPLGIILGAILAGEILQLKLPENVRYTHIVLLGIIASIGFTVSIFIATLAFTDQPEQDSAKAGALCSIVSALVVFALAGIVKIEKENR